MTEPVEVCERKAENSEAYGVRVEREKGTSACKIQFYCSANPADWGGMNPKEQIMPHIESNLRFNPLIHPAGNDNIQTTQEGEQLVMHYRRISIVPLERIAEDCFTDMEKGIQNAYRREGMKVFADATTIMKERGGTLPANIISHGDEIISRHLDTAVPRITKTNYRE